MAKLLFEKWLVTVGKKKNYALYVNDAIDTYLNKNKN